VVCRAVRRAAHAFGAQTIDKCEIGVLLNEALERAVGDARGIEAGSLDALAIGAAAAQGIKAVAGFDQKRADLGAGQFALQPVAAGNVAGAAGAMEKPFAGFEGGNIAACADVADAKAAVEPAAAA
jgi:hypothetical protein